jgi:hypothetical protein
MSGSLLKIVRLSDTKTIRKRKIEQGRVVRKDSKEEKEEKKKEARKQKKRKNQKRKR